jgi:phosphatidylethanolamine/phosphatidyl-N-methylethanolamine N-methyltransferase
MEINTNSWNRIRYTLYSPAYDLVGQVFSDSRQRSVRLLDIHRGDRVLLIGAGTGLDLPYLPKDISVTATDLTPAMVKRLAKRGQDLGLNLKALVMDGQKLDLPTDSYDRIMLHLILAVIPDPVACLREAERVLAYGGRIVVFDKFLPPGQKPGMLRRLTNNVTNFFFSDINRSIEEIVSRTNLRILRDEKADFGGAFRILVLGR